jgi:hypothetical protein
MYNDDDGWDFPGRADVDDEGFEVYDEATWNLAAEANTLAPPDTLHTIIPPVEVEEVDSAGTITEDGPVFGPLDEARWKQIDRFREIENHHTLGHDNGKGRSGWINVSGTSQCEYCRDIMWRYTLHCPDCDLTPCRWCAGHVS